MKYKNKYLYCRFCNYKTVKFYHRKNGTLSTLTAAFNRLENHIEREHPKEFKLHQEQMSSYRDSIPDWMA